VQGVSGVERRVIPGLLDERLGFSSEDDRVFLSSRAMMYDWVLSFPNSLVLRQTL